MDGSDVSCRWMGIKEVNTGFLSKNLSNKPCLVFLIIPSVLIFFLKIHLQSNDLFLKDKSVRIQILFSIVDSISLLIASFPNGASREFMASWKEVGVSSNKKIKKPSSRYFSTLVLLLLLSLGSKVNSTRIGLDDDDGCKSKDNGGSKIDLQIQVLKEKIFLKKVASLDSMMISFDIEDISELTIRNL